MPQSGSDASAGSALDGVRREAQRSIFRARNGIKLLTKSSPPQVGASPHDVVWRRGKARLLR
jgi:hypothetical protein